MEFYFLSIFPLKGVCACCCAPFLSAQSNLLFCLSRQSSAGHLGKGSNFAVFLPRALTMLCVIIESAEVFILLLVFHFSTTELYECCFIAVLICWHPYTFLLSV